MRVAAQSHGRNATCGAHRQPLLTRRVVVTSFFRRFAFELDTYCPSARLRASFPPISFTNSRSSSKDMHWFTPCTQSDTRTRAQRLGHSSVVEGQHALSFRGEGP